MPPDMSPKALFLGLPFSSLTKDDPACPSSVHVLTSHSVPFAKPRSSTSPLVHGSNWTRPRVLLLLLLLLVFLGSYALLPWVVREPLGWSFRCPENATIPVVSLEEQQEPNVTGELEEAELSGTMTSDGRPLSTALRFRRTKRRLPQCIIIGVRKCGTRALLEFLNLHPHVVKATQEVHFFDDDSRYLLGLEWYRRRMPYSFLGQITVEKSPSYFVTRHVPQRIRAMDTRVKLLLIVREPVTRAISDYAQIKANKMARKKPYASFEELATMSSGGSDGTTTMIIDGRYRALQIGLYADHLRHWLEVFPREQLHVVNGDRLVVDPLTELQRIEDFLGLQHRIAADNLYFNKTKGFFCLRNDTTDKCLSEAKGRKHPKVSEHLVHELRRFFAPHNQRFFDMVGQNFSWNDMLPSGGGAYANGQLGQQP